jgi:hypothetical protein
MSDPFLDHLPSTEREKVRKRLRSPEAYEKLREKVKGPEDLEKELAKAEKLADANLEMQTNPEAKEKVKKGIEKNLKEKGVEGVLEHAEDLPATLRAKLEQGKFTVAATADQGLSVVPEGNVSDKLPLKQTLSDQYITQLLAGAKGQ